MRKFFANLLALVMMLSFFAMNTSTAEANARIGWTTTEVILDAKKATIRGYFTNYGDKLGEVIKMRFILDVKTTDGDSLYSTVTTFSGFDQHPARVSAGGRFNYTFIITDDACPRYDPEKTDWHVHYTVTWD